MKRIPLTQSQFSIVDDADYERLSAHKWCADWQKCTKSFYAVRNSKEEKGKQIYMHRELLGLKRGNKRQADHIDHNTLDNRRSNLRIVTSQQNHFNRKNTKGYCWNKRARKYQAQIQLDGEKEHLGYFVTPKAARAAYLQAKEKLHQIG